MVSQILFRHRQVRFAILMQEAIGGRTSMDIVWSTCRLWTVSYTMARSGDWGVILPSVGALDYRNRTYDHGVGC